MGGLAIETPMTLWLAPLLYAAWWRSGRERPQGVRRLTPMGLASRRQYPGGRCQALRAPGRRERCAPGSPIARPKSTYLRGAFPQRRSVCGPALETRNCSTAALKKDGYSHSA